MRKFLALVPGLLMLFVGVALAGSTYDIRSIRGKRGRKAFRLQMLSERLPADKARVYDKYGYTPHRLRSNGYGRTTERWRYYTLGLEFTFDQDGYLISKRSIKREDGFKY